VSYGLVGVNCASTVTCGRCGRGLSAPNDTR